MTEPSVQPSTRRPTATDTQQTEAVAPAGDTAVRPGFAERLQSKLASSEQGGSTGATATSSARGPVKARAPRRARLRLTRIDPWSVMKTAFLLSIAFGIVTVVAVIVIWQVLGAAGVWDSINDSIRSSIGGQETADFDVENYVGASRVVGFTMLVAALDVVLLTAIATLGAFLYNMAAALLGGIEVTLAEEE